MTMSTPGIARPESIDDVPDTARREPAEAVANVSREELHFCRIDMRGYRRSDGLYIETFTDAAPYAMCPEGGRALPGLKDLRIVSGHAHGAKRKLIAGIWPKFHRPKRNED